MLSTDYLTRGLKQVYIYSTLDELCNTYWNFILYFGRIPEIFSDFFWGL